MTIRGYLKRDVTNYVQGTVGENSIGEPKIILVVSNC